MPRFTLTEETIDINSGNFLEKNHDVFLQLNKLKQHLTSYCLIDVFSIVTAFDPTTGAPDDSDPATISDYFDHYLDTSEPQIMKSNEAYRFWGDEIALENLNWSQDLMLNSCDEKLYEEVANKIYATPEEYRGGPLALYHIVQLTIKTTDRTARAIVNKLQQFKLNKIPNENINTAIAIVRSAVIRLRSANKMPSDMHHIVYDIFMSCSIYAFRSHFQTLETIESPKVLDWEVLLKEAEKVYLRLEYEGHWHPRVKKGATFSVSGERPKSNTTPTGSTAKPTHDKSGNAIDRTPPGNGAPQERKKGTKTEHWCGHERCGRWGNHPTSKHDEWVSQLKRRKTKKAAKATGTSPAPATTIATTAPATSTSNAAPPTRLRFANVVAPPTENF